jgi:5-methylcytosine-specific restriction endonuclease McrA
MKRCSGCGVVKDLDAFSVQRSDGRERRKSACKECTAAKARAYRELNLEKVKEQARSRYAANPEKAKERSQAWRDKNPEKVSEQHRRWRNADLAAARERSNRWHRDNPDRTKENRAAWRELNPEKILDYNRNRRVIRQAATTDEVDFESLRNSIDTCYLCNQHLKGEVHMDHIVPLSRNGAHSKENLSPVHGACNLRKGDRLLPELAWYTGPTDLGSANLNTIRRAK